MLLEITALPDLSDIVTAIGNAATWFWGLFGDVLDICLSNKIIFFTIALSIGAAVVFAVIKVVKRFGVRGKRYRV